MQTNSQFDYIIVGAGLSGLHLSYSFSKDEYFKDYSILIIDKNTSKKTDNYFSFWEIGKGKWDKILKNRWLKGNFFSKIDKVEITEIISGGPAWRDNTLEKGDAILAFIARA